MKAVAQRIYANCIPIKGVCTCFQREFLLRTTESHKLILEQKKLEHYQQVFFQSTRTSGAAKVGGQGGHLPTQFSAKSCDEL